MEQQQGLALWLFLLLTVRAVGHALAYQNANKQITAAEAGKTFAPEWRMEATAHVASLMVRDQQCKGDPANCDLQEGASDAIETLSKWAAGDKGWERLLSSVSLYAIARHAYQEAEYDEAIIALEESLALRLFAYADQKTLDRWQQGLVMPGSLFRRQKMDLANMLVLRSDCLVQLAREQRDVDDLTEAMELLQLATALLKGGDELVPDSVTAISRRAATISAMAAELLPQLKTSRVKEVLEHHGIACTGCSSKGDYLLRLVPLLRLPVHVAGPGGGKAASSSSSSSGGSLPSIEPLSDPFNSHVTALLKKPQEHVAQYMQRVFFRLLTLVPADYLAELDVACRRNDAKGRCISYLPLWVTAQAITIDKRTGLAHVSGPGACAGDGTGVGDDPALDVPPPGQASVPMCGGPGGGPTQLGSEPWFVPGDGSSSSGGSGGEPHNRAGLELCGFLHIRAIPPGVTLPTTGGSLTPQQQKVLKAKAAEGASGAALDTPFKGVYYYFYTDVPALVDRIINTFDPEEADFLFEALDGLTAARSLALAGRLPTPAPKHCNEAALLEGRAGPTCSVLVPNLGSCAKAPLKPPRRRMPLDPLPASLPQPPAVGTYTPRLRSRMPPEAAFSSGGRSGGAAGGWGDGSNASGERGEGSLQGDGSGSGDAAGSRVGPGGGGRAARHRSGHGHHHAHFPLTDRELSDRQLQEQMAKLARDAGRRDRDDPLVPLTLAGCAVASVGLYLASKRRRRGGFAGSSSGTVATRLVLLGLGTGRLKSSGSGASFTSSGGAAGDVAAGGLPGSGGSGSGGGPGDAAAAAAAAMSEDGSSSSSGGRPPSGSAAAATTPSKKLNPKAAPYNPNPAMLSQAGKAAAAQQGNAYQQQQAQQYHQQAGMFGGGAYGNVSSPAHGDYGSASAAFGGLPARGPSPVGGAGGLLGDLPISSGLLLSSHGSYGAGNDAGMDPASLDYQQQQQQGGLLGYRSADQGLLGGPGFDQGLTSPNHHHFQQLDGMGPALSPQQQQQQYGLPMHQQQQLLELLSAAGPGEAASGSAAGGGSSSVHSYSRSQELEVEVAAATTSANVAELVLGTSPMSAPGAVDAQMSKLAKEMMAGLID
ncbi:hypothetical protein OEZ86_007983 [Tetradesmus obliquus]|nr:hypothetical protein OEZ86_007983 [Tetradesmus obliquus]